MRVCRRVCVCLYVLVLVFAMKDPFITSKRHLLIKGVRLHARLGA